MRSTREPSAGALTRTETRQKGATALRVISAQLINGAPNTPGQPRKRLIVLGSSKIRVDLCEEPMDSDARIFTPNVSERQHLWSIETFSCAGP